MFLVNALRGRSVAHTTFRNATLKKMDNPDIDDQITEEPARGDEGQHPMEVSGGNEEGRDDGSADSGGRYVKAAAQRPANPLEFHLTRLKKVFKHTFTGSGSRDSIQSSWVMFEGVFSVIATQLDIPKELWAAIAFNCIDGAALKSALAATTNLATWDEFDAYFSQGPFQQTDTDYSIRTEFFDQAKWRVFKPHHVHALVRKCEVAFSKAPNALTDVEKIVAVQYNLPSEVRQQVMVNAQNSSFTSFEEFRRVLLTKVNAMPSSSTAAGGSSNRGRHEDNPYKRPRSGSNPRRSSHDQKHRRSSQEQQQPHDGPNSSQAGPSSGKGAPFKPCTGCGSTKHQVWWKDRTTGEAVCKAYDPAKAAGRRPHFQKRS